MSAPANPNPVTASAAPAAPAARPFQIRRKAASAGVPGVPVSTEAVFKNLTSSSKNTLSFRLAPTQIAYANALRRVVQVEVETVAFNADMLEDGTTSDVKIVKNSTPMSNEMIAHRIGLLPISVSNPLDWDPKEYSFKLNVVNDSSERLDVKAADIQVLKQRGPTEDPLPVPSGEFFALDPISQDTPLIAVLKGRVGNQEPESLIFEATATAGIGRQNARHIPVSQCSYKYTLDENPLRRKEFFEKWLKVHKKVDPSELDSNATRRGELEREFATMEVARCYLTDETNEPYSFDFVMESMGVLDPLYIIARAIQVLQQKMQQYMSIETGDLPENVTISPADARMKGYDFLFKREDHTLGNLLQTWIDTNLYASGDVTFVGYKIPHPLKDEMVFRIGVKDGKESSAREAIARAARNLSETFKQWGQQWAQAGTSAATPSVRSAMTAARQR
jgi:DNA-directed RNA polymerase subunit L/DNA-directed RNA polymerase alpha subunit